MSKKLAKRGGKSTISSFEVFKKNVAQPIFNVQPTPFDTTMETTIGEDEQKTLMTNRDEAESPVGYFDYNPPEKEPIELQNKPDLSPERSYVQPSVSTGKGKRGRKRMVDANQSRLSTGSN